MTSAFRQLLNRFAMIAFERQLVLMDRLGPEHEVELSIRRARAGFGAGREYGVQLLGTRAAATDTWLWAWANEAAPVPAEALAAVKKVKQVGKKRLAPELVEAEFPLEPVDLDAHTLALVATSIAELPAYYRFPYEGGALFAALEIPGFELPPPDARRIARVIEEVTNRIALEPRIAVETYLRERGATVRGERSRVQARFADGQELTAEFDEQGRPARLLLGSERPGAPAS